MAKQIKFEFEGEEYTLEFTRKSVETMERQGFSSNDIVDKPASTLPALFAGAFLAHHRYLRRDVIDKIYSKMRRKEELIGKLVEMYNDTIMTLLSEPEDTEGNVEWEARW